MIKDQSRNRCIVGGCNFHTTPEGLACRYHWRLLDGVLKGEYQRVRIAALKDIQYRQGKEK